MAALWDRAVKTIMAVTGAIAGTTTSAEPPPLEKVLGAEDDCWLRVMLRQSVRHTLSNNGHAGLADRLYTVSSARDEQMINKSDDVRQLFAVVKELIEDNKTELQQFTAMLFPLECNQSAAVDLSGVWRVLRMHFSRLKPTIAKLLTAVAFSGYVALHLEQRGIGFVKHVVRALEDGMVKFLHEFYGRLEAQVRGICMFESFRFCLGAF